MSHLPDVMVHAHDYLDTLDAHVEACTNEAAACAMLAVPILVLNATYPLVLEQLVDWIGYAARARGLTVQATSTPGASQRTDATT